MGRPSLGMDDLSIRVSNPCLQPFTDQVEKGPVVDTPAQHVQQPRMVPVVKEALDISLYQVAIPSVLEVKGEVSDRIQRPPSGATRVTRPAETCIHRFLPQVRPRRCSTVRSYGLLSPRRRTGLPPIRRLLATRSSHDLVPPSPPPQQRPSPRPASEQARRCRTCGGLLVFLVRLSPHPREPPQGQSRTACPGLASCGTSHVRRRTRHGRTARGDHSGLRTYTLARPAPSLLPVWTNALLQDGHVAALSPCVPLGTACTSRLAASASRSHPLKLQSALPPHRLVQPRIVWRLRATRILNTLGAGLASPLCPGYSVAGPPLPYLERPCHTWHDRLCTCGEDRVPPPTPYGPTHTLHPVVLWIVRFSRLDDE